MAQQQAQLTIAATATAFAALTAQQVSVSRDDQWVNQDLITLFQIGSATAGQDFHGYTAAQFMAYVAEFAVGAARLHANSKTNFKACSAHPQGSPRAVLFNRLRDLINNQGLAIPTLCATFATEIWNTLHTHGTPPVKWAKKGYKATDKYCAFPGAWNVDPARAQPPLTDGNLIAINANSKATIFEASSTSGTSHTTSSYFTGGVELAGNMPHRPGQLLLTNA